MTPIPTPSRHDWELLCDAGFDIFPSAHYQFAMSEMIQVKRALISVSDKSGLADFATALVKMGAQLISTGGTAKYLRDLGLEVMDVSAVTGFAEMMDGRVKTLHPNIHGGLLALRDNAEHVEAMNRHGIQPIDLVCINLYPFKQTIARPGVTFEEAIENIDIGGPSMIRSASKNHRFVLVLTDPAEYPAVTAELQANNGANSLELRKKQARKAFATTAEYDRLIADYLGGQTNDETDPTLQNLQKKAELRYGENPHQKGALYAGEQPGEASVAFAKQLHGKELSYINLLDADGALGTVKEFAEPAACIVKHTTPCGCAVGIDPAEAFRRAYEGDPLAAFGGIVALNRAIDLKTAEAITSIDKLLEVIVAPSFTSDALELLRGRWKNVRLLDVGPLGSPDRREVHLHKIVGGLLVQERDLLGIDRENWKVASQRQPTDKEWADLEFAWLVCKHIKSNAIAIARDGMLVGAGAGQMDRVAAARIAIGKATGRTKGAVAASDAFFPFSDGPQLLLDSGVTAIIQPGGAMRDQETIAAVDKAGAAMVLTGQRHFMH